MADPSAFITLAREVLAADASASTEEEHWVAKVALQTLAVNALPALLEVAGAAVEMQERLIHHESGCRCAVSSQDEPCIECVRDMRAIKASRAALARLAEVPGE